MTTPCTHEHPCAAYAALQAENIEQARLLGKSAERELALQAQVRNLTEDQIEGMGEAMYTLSAQLALTGWFEDDTNCEIYERVVKQWQALCDA